MRRFPTVEPLPGPGSEIELAEEASHHLLHVCRIPRGARVVLFDGEGRQAIAELLGSSHGTARLRLISSHELARPRGALHLVLGLPKGPAFEHALRMAVELGVTHVHPILAARSVARAERRERWTRVIRSACQQCGRADEPVLASLGSVSDALSSTVDVAARYLALVGAAHADGGAAPSCALAVGPEGGFTPTEVAGFVEAGWMPLGLARFTLRTDTAVAAGLARLQPDPPPLTPDGSEGGPDDPAPALPPRDS